MNEMLHSRMVDCEAIRTYAFPDATSKATFTLVSEKTGNRFSYRVRSSDRPDFWFVDLLGGPDNETDWYYIGVVTGHSPFGPCAFRPGKKENPEALHIAAMHYLMRMLATRDELPANFRFWHAGHCLLCGRLLTTPESIERGIGPVCLEKATP